ncbi:hypothetical protein RIF29_22853 [Crotalaria pallida]|uniref:SKP1 component dimerisation domain-containing protein n=1 Tax=Crotalaria pallida TaxID=3830 RepID=A0AAN9IAM6_CROPI
MFRYLLSVEFSPLKYSKNLHEIRPGEECFLRDLPSCTLHVEAAAATDDKDLKAWDADFANVDQATLYDLIMAANYLDIKSLLDLICQTVADMIKGKSPEEIRKIFNIKNDFTPEEEEEIKKENKWAFE